MGCHRRRGRAWPGWPPRPPPDRPGPGCWCSRPIRPAAVPARSSVRSSSSTWGRTRSSSGVPGMSVLVRLGIRPVGAAPPLSHYRALTSGTQYTLPSDPPRWSGPASSGPGQSPADPVPRRGWPGPDRPPGIGTSMAEWLAGLPPRSRCRIGGARPRPSRHLLRRPRGFSADAAVPSSRPPPRGACATSTGAGADSSPRWVRGSIVRTGSRSPASQPKVAASTSAPATAPCPPPRGAGHGRPRRSPAPAPGGSRMG